jgi:non-heme Fe2+,alpha-ketoglutarate-dependent halogenase
MHLTDRQVADFRRDGCVHPIRVLSPAEAAGYRARLEAYEKGTGAPIHGNLRHKTHLLFTWADELVHHPEILEAVSDVIGPDILCWTTNFFIKEPSSAGFVSWHQDSTYWGLDPADVVTAWVAFTDATPENGYMQYIPGTHTVDQLPHLDTFHRDNLLSRGQEIAVEVDEAHAVDLVLRPGQMSLHHVKIFHGSHQNRADDRRIGFAIRYLPPHVHQEIGADAATLVRGEDRFGHFELEPAPAHDLAPDAIACHQRVRDRRMAILMRDAAEASKAAHAAGAM